MPRPELRCFPALLIGLITFALLSASALAEVVRPEEIKSKRLVIYDDETYRKLAGLWKDYNNAYPSEYAYANWMYASRYAGAKDYPQLLDKGIEKYPSNPTLLYLKAVEHHGLTADVEGLKYLEKAVALDPSYTDPWFLLVTHYMDSGDKERLELALRKLLESGIISDEVMDYNYNMLIGLEKDAIIITNGDNDTYPGWILTRLLRIRPDVSIVNRSLLNTEWYPIYVIEQGVPRFIDKNELATLRKAILEKLKDSKANPSAGGLFGDTLILRVIDAAKRAGRPVYFSRTVYITDQIREVAEKGRNLGLVTLATPSSLSYAEQVKNLYGKWLDSFRTGGLQGWRLRNAPLTDAGRMIIFNYAAALIDDLESIKKNAPELRSRLFHWYLENLEKLVRSDLKAELAEKWCRYAADIKEISTWGTQQGLKCSE